MLALVAADKIVAPELEIQASPDPMSEETAHRPALAISEASALHTAVVDLFRTWAPVDPVRNQEFARTQNALAADAIHNLAALFAQARSHMLTRLRSLPVLYVHLVPWAASTAV